mgnify:CR=1 FL=1
MNSGIKKYKVIGLILLYGVYINIFLMGDDFLFASYHIKGIRNLFFQVLNYGRINYQFIRKFSAML